MSAPGPTPSDRIGHLLRIGGDLITAVRGARDVVGLPAIRRRPHLARGVLRPAAAIAGAYLAEYSHLVEQLESVDGVSDVVVGDLSDGDGDPRAGGEVQDVTAVERDLAHEWPTVAFDAAAMEDTPGIGELEVGIDVEPVAAVEQLQGHDASPSGTGAAPESPRGEPTVGDGPDSGALPLRPAAGAESTAGYGELSGTFSTVRVLVERFGQLPREVQDRILALADGTVCPVCGEALGGDR